MTAAIPPPSVDPAAEGQPPAALVAAATQLLRGAFDRLGQPGTTGVQQPSDVTDVVAALGGTVDCAAMVLLRIERLLETADDQGMLSRELDAVEQMWLPGAYRLASRFHEVLGELHAHLHTLGGRLATNPTGLESEALCSFCGARLQLPGACYFPAEGFDPPAELHAWIAARLEATGDVDDALEGLLEGLLPPGRDRWYACAECRGLVDTASWAWLQGRSGVPAEVNRPLWQAFAVARTGPPVEVTDLATVDDYLSRGRRQPPDPPGPAR